VTEKIIKTHKDDEYDEDDEFENDPETRKIMEKLREEKFQKIKEKQLKDDYAPGEY
jgi:hypothetical protein